MARIKKTTKKTGVKEPQIEQRAEGAVCPDCGSFDLQQTSRWDAGGSYRCRSCRRRFVLED